MSSISGIRRIYPLLVVDDPALASPGTNTFLAEHFAKLGPHETSVSPPTLCTVDEFEEIAPYLGAGEITWIELLDPRFRPDSVVATPLHNSFVDIAKTRRLSVKPNRVTAAAGARLHALIEEKYRKLAPEATDGSAAFDSGSEV